VAHCAKERNLKRDMQAEDDSTPLRPTRASFVRGLPESMPIEEVIERGREAGISLNPSDVHSTRYYMRQEALAQLSSRPAVSVRPPSMPQLVQATPLARTNAEKPKPDARPTNILGLRAATNGKERPVVKPRRTPAAPRAATPAAPVKKAAKMPTLPPVKLSGSLEEQLRKIVLRIGTERARRIIELMENLKV
jgi:hypothetical protein